MEPMNTPPDKWIRLKIFLGVECVLGLIALVLPITPSKTGEPFVWPPDLASYFRSVLAGLLMGHGVLGVLAMVAWVSWIFRGRPALTEKAPPAPKDRESPSP